MAENNNNNLITVSRLSQFLQKLKAYLAEHFYSKTESNDTFAKINGDASEDFHVKEVTLNTPTDTYVKLSRETDGDVNYLKMLDDDGITTRLKLDGGYVYTTNMFRLDDIASAVSVYPANSKTKFLNCCVPSVFNTPSVSEGNTISYTDDDGDLVADGMKNSVGSLVFITNPTQGFPTGFYMVIMATGGQANPTRRLNLVSKPNSYSLYYNTTSGNLCYWGIDDFISITTASGDAVIIGGDEYHIATDADITNMFNELDNENS